MGVVDTWNRIGLFGGTFDPLHVGHVAVAKTVRDVCKLDVVLLEVAANPWQKADRDFIAPAELRYQIVDAGTRSIPGLLASRREIDRGGVTYTVDTLRCLRAEFPDAEIFLIGGADMAAGLATWHEPAEISRLADLVIVNRPGTATPSLDAMWRVHQVEMPEMNVSSSEIRNRIASGLPIDSLIPAGALELVMSSDHYRRATYER